MGAKKVCVNCLKEKDNIGDNAGICHDCGVTNSPPLTQDQRSQIDEIIKYNQIADPHWSKPDYEILEMIEAWEQTACQA